MKVEKENEKPIAYYYQYNVQEVAKILGCKELLIRNLIRKKGRKSPVIRPTFGSGVGRGKMAWFSRNDILLIDLILRLRNIESSSFLGKPPIEFLD